MFKTAICTHAFFSQPRAITITRSRENTLNNLTSALNAGDVCIYWYCGSHGLKEDSINFYRESLTNALQIKAVPFLVDLTAWGRMENLKCSLSNSNSNIDKICSTGQLHAFKTSDHFLNMLKSETRKPIIDLIQSIFKRTELFAASAQFDDKKISMLDVFGEGVDIIEPIRQIDAAKAYSVLQYVEFLYIVQHILTQCPETTRIKFMLPNDEDKYYTPSLSDDLSRFLAANNMSPKTLDIAIDCFNYGSELHHRPYNAPGKVVKKTTFDMVVNTEALTHEPSQMSFQ